MLMATTIVKIVDANGRKGHIGNQNTKDMAKLIWLLLVNQISKIQSLEGVIVDPPLCRMQYAQEFKRSVMTAFFLLVIYHVW